MPGYQKSLFLHRFLFQHIRTQSGRLWNSRRRVVTAELLISIILFNPTAFFILLYILFILWVHFFFPNPFLLQISFRSVFSGKAGRMPTQYQVSLWTGNSIFKVQKRDFFKICVTPSLIAY